MKNNAAKPYIKTFQRLLASCQADARLCGGDKVHLFEMLEGYTACALAHARAQADQVTPPTPQQTPWIAALVSLPSEPSAD